MASNAFGVGLDAVARAMQSVSETVAAKWRAVIANLGRSEPIESRQLCEVINYRALRR
jgi:hypothetical protein